LRCLIPKIEAQTQLKLVLLSGCCGNWKPTLSSFKNW